jgi:hypothetical protein
LEGYLFRQLSSDEPDRYLVLQDLGSPVSNCNHPDPAWIHDLVERSGGPYVDTGPTILVTESKVSFVAGIELNA